MNQQLVLKAGVVGLVVSVAVGTGIWFLFVDSPPLTESDLNATTPDPTISTAPSQFTMTVEVTSRSLDEGSEQTNWSAGVTYNADSQERLGWLNSTSSDGDVSIVHYQRYSHNATQNFIRYYNSDPDEFDDRVDSIRDDLDPETETLTVNDRSHTYVYSRTGAKSEFEVVPDLIPPLGFMQTIPFEHDGTTTFEGNDVEIYRPVHGWGTAMGSVDDDPNWYISNTSGVVYVSEESGNIVRADVSTTSTRTDIRAGKWFGDRGDRAHITLSIREELTDDELRPKWATESAST